jgi:hypothetical protein
MKRIIEPCSRSPRSPAGLKLFAATPGYDLISNIISRRMSSLKLHINTTVYTYRYVFNTSNKRRHALPSALTCTSSTAPQLPPRICCYTSALRLDLELSPPAQEA